MDVFLVLSGYLIIPKILRQIEEGRFEYFSFIEKRLFRLLPLVLLVSGVVLAIGYWVMLPGDYYYLSEEAVAASVFANNILQSITTQNYWAAIYHKVLMHTWYLGVLFQFYVLFPLLMLLMHRWMKHTLVVLTLVSLLLYLLPIDTIGDKYYLLPYRFFEISVGGLLAMTSRKSSSSLSFLSLGLLLFMIFFGAFTVGERSMPYNLVGGTNTIRESFLPREALVLLTVLFTLMFLFFNSEKTRICMIAQQSRIIAPLGRMSLSIFLWHQPIIAFYRYLYADNLSVVVLIMVATFTLLLSFVTYILIERRLRISIASRLGLIVSFLLVVGFALWVYSQGGQLGMSQNLTFAKERQIPKLSSAIQTVSIVTIMISLRIEQGRKSL